MSSRMYGKRRVVLGTKPTRLGRKPVAVAGGKSFIPLGYWYEQDGRFYADLKPEAKRYQLVSNDDLAKGLGGCKTQKDLREFVMDYFTKGG